MSFVANWMTAWERTGDEKYLEYIKTGMKGIVDMPHGIFSSSMFGYDPETKMMYNVGVKPVRSASHLAFIMGGYETMMELLDLVDYPEFEQDWLEYCRQVRLGAVRNWAKVGQKGKQRWFYSSGIRGRQVMQLIKKMMPNLQNEPGGNFSIARLKARPLLFRGAPVTS